VYLSDIDFLKIENELYDAYFLKAEILDSLKKLKTEGFLKKSDEIENFLYACYESVKYKGKLNILDILELSDSDFQEFIKIYKSKEKEIGFPINKGQRYVKDLKNKRTYSLIFATLYVIIMLAVLPFTFRFHPENWLIYGLIIIIPWFLLLAYIIFLSKRIYKFNEKLSIKYNNKEYIPPLKLYISQIEWIQNEVTYDFPMFVKEEIDYVMSLPDTVECGRCYGTGKVQKESYHTEFSPHYEIYYGAEGARAYRQGVDTKEIFDGFKDVKCDECGGLGYFYTQKWKDKIRALGYKLINDFNRFYMYPDLKDEIQRLNSKLQIYISRLRLINDTFYS
jgi:hypothetical protein